ncbi:MAG: type III secretion protein [Puniceicoccales bacterium]|jgi:chromosome segregation ATPase|nr:type III secretion protein [Puniceicoccales bacterium]
MKYVLADLVRVRVLRRDRVERELLKAKEHLAEMEKMVPIREKELEDYEKWVDQEIDRQYAELLRQAVRKGSVDDLKENIRIMRSKTPEYVKRVQDAKNDVKKAEEELEAKRKEMEQAHRNLEKLYAHREEWTAEQLKLDEFNSDKELEEAVRQKSV